MINELPAGDRRRGRLSAEVGGCSVVAELRGCRLTLHLVRDGEAIAGWFESDGPVALGIIPRREGNGPVPIPGPSRPSAPPGERAAAAEPADRSPVVFARRTVYIDDRGEPERAEWEKLSPADFEAEVAAARGTPVPARDCKVPRSRVDEYYDGQGRLCHAVWTPRRGRLPLTC